MSYQPLSLSIGFLALGFVGYLSSTSCAQPPTSAGELFRLREEVNAQRIKELIPDDSSGKTLAGYVTNTADGKAGINLGQGLIVPVSNPDALEKLPQNIASQFKVVRLGNTVRVDDAELEILSNWKESKRLLPQNQFTKVHRSFGELDSTINKIMQTGSMSAENEELYATIADATEATVEAYRQVPAADMPKREILCKQFKGLRELQLKARFGREDNYWPEVYRKIYDNSRTAVAVTKKGQNTPFGSGVLIGDSLVLTCRHVAKKYPIDQLEVWCDYEQTTDGQSEKTTYPVKSLVFEGQKLDADTNPLDFALLDLKPNDDGPAHMKFKSAKLGKLEMARDDPLYVIGHPNQQPRMVHDNAFVLFPFRVNDFGMTQLQMIVCAEIQASPNLEDELNEFLKSYVKSADDEYRLYSQKWNKSPVIAADCDTFHGNSGSGAWERRSGLLVGILFAGEYDHGESYTAGWRRHEAILPMPVIVKQLDGAMIDWRTKYNVVLE